MKARLQRGLLFLIILTVTFFGGDPQALSADRKEVTIGFIGDGPPAGRLDLNADVFKREILEVTRAEFDVRFPPEKHVFADWTEEGINRAIDSLLDDPDVDIIITLGSISSNEICQRRVFPKPVIAPIIIDVELQGLPFERGASGVKNLSYITSFKKAGRDIKLFQRMVPFTQLSVIADRLLLETFPRIAEEAKKIGRENQAELSLIPATDSADHVLKSLSPETEAVFLASLVRFTPSEFKRLVAGLIEKRLPTFSLYGRQEVEEGILASVSPSSDFTRLARRVALNVQRILIGEDPGTFQVGLLYGQNLTINMATARAIGYSPPFDVLIEAERINEKVAEGARKISLSAAVKEAVEANLDLAASDREVAAGRQEVRIAKSVLFPQLEISAVGAVIDDDRARASLGTRAERTLAGSATLTQLIYSDDAWSNFGVSRSVQMSREEERERLRLDISLESSLNYLNLLKTITIEDIQEENLKVTKSNLELARFRQVIGYSGPSDVYRWESELANDRIEVLQAIAQRRVSEIALNRVLHRPLEEEVVTEETSVYDPELIISEERLFDYVDNPDDFGIFRNFVVQEGILAAPELRSIDAAIAAEQRILLAAKRAFWIPTFSLQADVTQTLSEEGEGSDPSLTGVLPVSLPRADDTDWTISVLATFPLLEGGAKRAELKRSTEELARLRLDRMATVERVEERIRATLQVAGASYTSIRLSRDAAVAARKNLEIITDSYSQGAVGILELLDAQNASLVADLQAANAVTDFMIAFMNVQRAQGRFDFFQTPEEREDWFRRLDEFFLREKALKN